MGCTRTGCPGTMTYHQKLTITEDAEPTVRPSGSVARQAYTNDVSTLSLTGRRRVTLPT